jgi:hypothetical protein
LLKREEPPSVLVVRLLWRSSISSWNA